MGAQEQLVTYFPRHSIPVCVECLSLHIMMCVLHQLLRNHSNHEPVN